MLSLTKPSNEQCLSILDARESAALNYKAVGCLKTGTPPGFNRDKARCVLGQGQPAWDAAVESFAKWKFMPASMVEIKNSGPIELGRVVGVLFKAIVIWSFNPARILEIHDSKDDEKSTFGFTYGTVRGHVEQGEERFLLAWDHETDTVAYELEAVSKPMHLLAWLVYPYARMMQARFRKESCEAMVQSVGELIEAASTVNW